MIAKYKLKNIDCASCAAKIETKLSKKDEFDPQKEITKIILVGALFLIGVIFEDTLHESFFAFVEYFIFISAYLIAGWPVLKTAFKDILRGKFFDENFLMTLATLGAIAIHDLAEATAVMVFYQVGEFFQKKAVHRSRRSIKSLLELRPDYANVKINGEIKKVSPYDVVIDTTIVIKPGEKIPLDGIVIEGRSQVDTAALTGESKPKIVLSGETVLAGGINKMGYLSVRVTKLFGESSISRILELVENASSKKAATEKFVSKLSSYYTPIVIFISLMVAFVLPVLTQQSFSSWIYRALVLLVISCPCALVISIPMGYFGGIGGAARKGILIKGANFLDVLTDVKTVVFDKTGTLTQGVFKVVEIHPKNGFSKEEVLESAAMAESQSNHPIAQSIMSAYGKGIDSSLVSESQEIMGQGIKAKINGKTIIAGNDYLLHTEKIEHDVCVVDGTVVHIGVEGRYLGYIVISDQIKEDSLETIQLLKAFGIRTIMLTGDNKFTAKTIAEKLHIDTFYAELLPEDKVKHLENIMQGSLEGKVAFVGDGINDAPVLARADVGIAMGALGSDVAVETADIVIMTDSLSKLVTAIDIAKRTHKIVWQNIGLVLVVKVVFIFLGSLGMATMWEAVFADMGTSLVAILNVTRLLK